MNTVLLIIGGLSLCLFLLGALRKSRKRTSGTITEHQAAGFFLWQAFDHWCNYVLFPMFIASAGFVKGGIMMVIFSLIGNVAFIVINNATEADWTFMSWFTYLRDTESRMWPLRYCRLLKASGLFRFRKCLMCGCGYIRRAFKWKLGRFKIANAIAFLYLSVWKDSFFAINFLYHKKTDLRKIKVLSLFLVSHVICNLAWLPVAGTLGVFGKYIINTTSSFF